MVRSGNHRPSATDSIPFPSSAVIDKFKADQDAPLLAYFYFDFNDTEKQDCRALVSSLVFQIGTRTDKCLDRLKSARASDPSGDHPTYNQLVAMLSDLLLLSGPTVIVIDALDELPEPARQSSLLHFLDKLCHLDSDRVDLRVLVTSRPEADIWRLCMSKPAPLATHFIDFDDAKQHREELKAHIVARLSGSDFSWWPAVAKAQAESILIGRSNGM